MGSLALDLWAQSEGMPDDWFNWLAHTDRVAGCYAPATLPDGSRNTDGVVRCPTHAAGVIATVYALNLPYYTHVKFFFQATLVPEKLNDIWTAINASPWCGHCQGGLYPIRLYNYLHEHGAPEPMIVAAKQAQARQKPVARPVTLLNGWAYLMKGLRVTAPKQLARSRANRAAILSVVKYRRKRPRRP
jgi:hypothetical protein